MATRKLLDSLDAQPHYRLMTAEQAVKILDRIFAEDSKSALEVSLSVSLSASLPLSKSLSPPVSFSLSLSLSLSLARSRALSLSPHTHKHAHTSIRTRAHTQMQREEQLVSNVFLTQGASILYKASVEPQRFLLHLGPLCVIVVLLGLVWAEAPVGLSCKVFSLI